MSDTKHTPGPWRLEHGIVSAPHGLFITRDVQDGERYVARMDGSTHAALETKANARLIASAPELLDVAIKLLDDQFRHNDFATWCADRKLAREVIERAATTGLTAILERPVVVEDVDIGFILAQQPIFEGQTFAFSGVEYVTLMQARVWAAKLSMKIAGLLPKEETRSDLCAVMVRALKALERGANDTLDGRIAADELRAALESMVRGKSRACGSLVGDPDIDDVDGEGKP